MKIHSKHTKETRKDRILFKLFNWGINITHNPKTLSRIITPFFFISLVFLFSLISLFGYLGYTYTPIYFLFCLLFTYGFYKLIRGGITFWKLRKHGHNVFEDMTIDRTVRGWADLWGVNKKK